MCSRIILLLSTVFMLSCEADAVPQGDLCAVSGDNLLQNSHFEQRTADGGLTSWQRSQHAGDSSYDVNIEGGELTITKTGPQPWFLMRQKIKAKALTGKKLALTAELKLGLTNPKIEQAFKVGGGLQIVARSSDAKGRKILLRSLLNHEPRIGTTEWHNVQVIIEPPKGTASLEIGVLHQADGVMSIRNPSLKLVDESDRECALTSGVVIGKPKVKSGLR